MINKTSLKFILGAFFIIGLGMVVWFVSVGASPEAKQEREARAYFENLKEQYENDIYGGDTPEETLALFIEALERGDVELASKYFVIDEQEEWRGKLVRIKEEDLLDEMTADLKREKYKYSISDVQVGFDIANDEREIALTILVGEGPNKLWKILDM